MSRIILVAGATGGVGSMIVQQLQDSGKQIRLLVRNRKQAVAMFGSTIETAVGDTRKPASLKAAIANIDEIICATGSRNPGSENSPEQVDYRGVDNLVQAAVEAGVHQFVLVSSIAVTKSDHPLNRFGRVLEWKLKGEQALRTSGLAYTIIRPGGLTDGPGGNKRLSIGQGDQITGMVSRSDVARLCIAALNEPAARNVTFEVVENGGEPLKKIGEYFKVLKPD